MLHPNLKSFNHAPHKKYYAEVLLKSEIDKYQQFEQQQLLSNNNNMNILIYWNNNKSLYPILTKIAQRLLAILATNICVEHLFFDSGNTITSHRTRLQTSKVDQLLFIHRNISTLKELFPPSIEQLTKRKITILQ
ncbi:unnamed protein product [Rotaria sordida]|uniref:HAT C-terminal dimerisation domain-containing protein n=1 Tax=Rotaria sordida TaxID=392033 RepID=A0A814D0R6_9BILA|nr:unnamed protein product [Rotaria sordida]CAF4032851.1 unnamed protein product [Rotaria sordida]